MAIETVRMANLKKMAIAHAHADEILEILFPARITGNFLASQRVWEKSQGRES